MGATIKTMRVGTANKPGSRTVINKGFRLQRITEPIYLVIESSDCKREWVGDEIVRCNMFCLPTDTVECIS